MENLRSTAGPEQEDIIRFLLEQSDRAILALPAGGCSRHVTSRTVELTFAGLDASEFHLQLTDEHQARFFETGAMTLNLTSRRQTEYTLEQYGKLTLIKADEDVRHYRMDVETNRLQRGDGAEWVVG